MKRTGPLTPQVRRRALALLASCPDGCTEAILAAHNIPAEIVVKLLRQGLAKTQIERVVAAGQTLEVSRLRITERGRMELTAS
jgi:uncharacterized metal-binding protein